MRFPGEWSQAAINNEAIMVARRVRQIVRPRCFGRTLRQAHVPVVQAMLRAYTPTPGTWLYGPICVAQSVRGQGVAGALFDVLRARFPGRESITFIRRDNPVSRRAHAKMGMTEVAAFTHDGIEQIVVVGSNLA